MQFSSKYEYTLLALLELATAYPKGEYLHIRQIAELQNIPSRYLEQILATLRKGGLIQSTRGSKGGYILTREPSEITLLDAFNCIEGGSGIAAFTTNQSIGKKVVQSFCLEAYQAVNSVLQQYTLQDLRERQENQSQTQLMYYI
ncbi:Rrf2 family transcriptional regulator [Chlorogloeopsis sp. ULAP01]|uniref:RrF2 family transcriptional regulator n=1 Tax=Chlorogloeopsis sp. ULAP01 TaxID=3056483 RepID=UPI0025AAB244|nr:Rrf2 family transcriptional regulator [Chlorogloeopsis sp. ULAP01]MDM9384056.1 Rrf2 family transcriptional regulator [Chlorogloeopsis sp. ULAP01]